MTTVNILIVEDEPLVAEDIAYTLKAINFSVAGIAYNGNEALDMLEKLRPDAALLDITLGEGPDGIEIATVINKKYGIPVVFLTSHADRITINRVKETNPAAYLVKPFDENDLMTSLEIAIHNHMSRPKPKAFTQEFINEHIPTPLSEREFEILNLLKEGKSNKEIGDALHLSVNTIKTHLLKVYEKLDAKNRTEALFRINKVLV